MIILIMLMTLLTGCSKANQVVKCYYPKFPSPNQEVKQILKKQNNKDFLKWINDIVIFKEKMEVLDGTNSK